MVDYTYLEEESKNKIYVTVDERDEIVKIVVSEENLPAMIEPERADANRNLGNSGIQKAVEYLKFKGERL